MNQPKLTLVDRIVAVCDGLDRAGIPWALGGALALAYATEEPRGTRDIDVNVFVPATRAADVLAAMPAASTAADVAIAQRDDQVRVMWDDTPIDVFFSSDRYHDDVDHRCRTVPFAHRMIRVLCAEDLAVFKALFDRSKDWVDIEAMVDSRAVDIGTAAALLEQLVPGDPRVERLRSIGR